MLRAVASRHHSFDRQLADWLAESDELLAELRAGNHAYFVWRLVESADFVDTVLRPRLPEASPAARLAASFVDLVWQRRLALVQNTAVDDLLDRLGAAVRAQAAAGEWLAAPVTQEVLTMETLRATNGMIHAAIDDHLARHLEALTALDLAAAGAAWQVLKAELHAHADAEDALVVPCYDRLGQYRPGGQPAMFTAEHNGIRRLLGKLEVQQEHLAEHDHPRRAMVDGLDRYLMLRHLLEHHTLREQNILYDQLEKFADPATLSRLREALVEARPWHLLGSD